VIEHLVEGGHEVFAIDWIGHGASDKPLDVALIPFELHMRTLKSCIDHFELTGCYIVAHDWGGYVHM
jgi:pimeloyl-ACP methyl ester carboxylesterase